MAEWKTQLSNISEENLIYMCIFTFDNFFFFEKWDTVDLNEP